MLVAFATMMTLAVTGAQGQLGRAVTTRAVHRGLSVTGCDVDTVDLRAQNQVEAWFAGHRPDVVVNCAAYTAVDAAESDPETARAVNATAVGVLADLADRAGALLVQVSTDYVFDGQADRPYREDDLTGPRSVYGRTKLEGERLARRAGRHLIVRTAWLYGHGGRNFVEAIRNQVDSGRDHLRVVADQRGCPTTCDDLAEAILDLVAVEATGVFHAVNSGDTTWHGLARAIVEILGARIEVEPVATGEFPTVAPRPAYSVLDTGRLEARLGRRLPGWRDALHRYLTAPCGG